MNIDKKVKLIVCDIDGTLIDDRGIVPEANKSSLLTAFDRGIMIALCSGRFSYDASDIALKIGLNKCFIIGLNGAHCINNPYGESYKKHYISNKSLNKCLSVLKDYNVSFVCFSDNNLLLSKENQAYELSKCWVPNIDNIKNINVDFIKNISSFKANKIAYADFESADRLKSIRNAISQIEGVDITSSSENNIEIMPVGINKGLALQNLASLLNLPSSSIMAIGDNDNDLSMLKFAGISVAMGNASNAVKDVAKFITDTNNNAGLSKIINEIAL